jgi:putative two-component system protein, hydrogenase maturation factor HypX/HoxX
MLKTAIPESIWRRSKSMILHPGIRGDRGPSSLDWAIKERRNEWGVTVVEADKEMDAGAIWNSRNFKFDHKRKSSLYNQEVADAATEALLESTKRYFDGGYVPETLDYSRADVKGKL